MARLQRRYPGLLFFPFLILASGGFWSWRFLAGNLIAPRACLLHLLFAVATLLAAQLASALPALSAPSLRRGAWHAGWALWLLLLQVATGGNFLSRSLCGLLAGGLLLAGLFRLYVRLVDLGAPADLAARLRTPAAILLLALLVAGGMLLPQHPDEARQEPLVAFFGGAGNVTDLNGLDTYRKLAAELDRQVLPTYSGIASRPRTNVILILADSLRADHLPLYGYPRQTTPFLSELAASGALQRVDHAYSACSESYCGIAVALTGQPFFKVSPQSSKIYQLLARVGYGNAMALVGDHDVFADLGKFYGPEANRALPPEVAPIARNGDDRAVLEALDRLEPATGKPQFLFFFLLSSHVLGQRFADANTFQPDNILAIRERWNSLGFAQVLQQIARPPTYLQKVINHYDNGILQLDFVLRGIFERLQRKGYLDDAIVLISGDHGDALGEHDHLGHTFRLYDEDIRVPLLVWDSLTAASSLTAAGGLPRRRLNPGGHASHVDLVPTILDRLGLPIPLTMPGISLYRPAAQRLSVHMTRRGQQPCAAAILSAGAALHKLIACRQGDVLREELYDLIADPAESRNLVAPSRDGEPTAELLAELRESLHFFYGDLVNTCHTFDCIDPKPR